MELEIKQSALNELYRLFEETLAPYSHACHKSCDHCCGTRVTATTLELWPVWQQRVTLKTDEKSALLPVNADTRPRITINHLAARCANNGPIPDQTEPVATESHCLFLANQCCQLYPVRPFACRMMVSAHNCGEFGYAEVKPLILTIANIFMQAIEHLDQAGLTGHMGDLLRHFDDENIRNVYRTGKKLESTATLLANHPLTTLMVPPEHRLQAIPVAQKINTVLTKAFSYSY